MPFKVEKSETVLTVHCPAEIEEVDVKLWKIQTKSWLTDSCKKICLDMKETESFLQTFTREVVQFQRELQAVGKTLSSTNIKPATLKKLEEAGLVKVFNPQ